jgi:uncharacterized protein (DUF433 family)
MIQVTDQRVPLSLDEGGLFRIAGTRVALDCVVEAWQNGASPEELVEQYDSLQLDDIYAVITFYLRHQEEVDKYLARQKAESGEALEAAQSNFPESLHKKLLKAKRTRQSRDD